MQSVKYGKLFLWLLCNTSLTEITTSQDLKKAIQNYLPITTSKDLKDLILNDLPEYKDDINLSFTLGYILKLIYGSDLIKIPVGHNKQGGGGKTYYNLKITPKL